VVRACMGPGARGAGCKGRARLAGVGAGAIGRWTDFGPGEEPSDLSHKVYIHIYIYIERERERGFD
jgi:hypothetical protein